VKVSPILTTLQKRVLKRFYGSPARKISLDKIQRDSIWKSFVQRREIENENLLKHNNPALYAEIARALTKGKNIQPAVFSECIYSQELARIFELSNFQDHLENSSMRVDLSGIENPKLGSLTIRYSYQNSENLDLLVQAGGASGVDCAFYSKAENELAMIELKEPYARTSDGNLPKYGEDGYIVNSEKFANKYPQLVPMLEEHIKKHLNAFEHLGSNVNVFSEKNIEKAVSENYSGEKFADFICTEDIDGYLVMLPSIDVARWATLEGEIRPSGRNHAKVWTPLRLKSVLTNKGASIHESKVELALSEIKTSNARGSSNVSRYKIDPAFFVYERDIKISGEKIQFKIDSVRQLIPSITAKMNFKSLNYDSAKAFYMESI